METQIANSAINHLKAVANMADEKCRFGYEIGLCHDLFEDTDCTEIELRQALDRFGYSYAEQFIIVSGVVDLTDIYTPELFPQLNRAKRKEARSEKAKLCKL